MARIYVALAITVFYLICLIGGGAAGYFSLETQSQGSQTQPEQNATPSDSDLANSEFAANLANNPFLKFYKSIQNYTANQEDEYGQMMEKCRERDRQWYYNYYKQTGS